MGGRVLRFAFALALAGVLAAPPAPAALGQIDRAARQRAMAATVAVALVVDVAAGGAPEPSYVQVGSGTVVSADGLILTNRHVVDMAAHRAQLDRWEAGARREGKRLTFDLDEDRVLILGADADGFALPRFTAAVAAEDAALDLAVLRVTGDARGRPVPPAILALPFLPLGDSDALTLGDPLDVFAYPTVGGDSLSYSTGVVSGFQREDGVPGRAWIKTDATLSGGSSGGAALDRAGNLVGVPTRGAALDCRPGDTDGDGALTAADVGCVPTGGSFGEVRPINLARAVLREAGYREAPTQEAAAVAAAPTRAPAPTPTATPRPTEARGGMSFDDYLERQGYGPTPTPSPVTPPVASCLDGPVYAKGTRVEVVRPTHLLSQDATRVLLPDDASDADRRFINKAYTAIKYANTKGMIAFWVNGRQINPGDLTTMTQEERDALALEWLDGIGGQQATLQPGAVLEITGPFVEWGACDGWPVVVVAPESVAGMRGFVPERQIRALGDAPLG